MSLKLDGIRKMRVKKHKLSTLALIMLLQKGGWKIFECELCIENIKMGEFNSWKSSKSAKRSVTT